MIEPKVAIYMIPGWGFYSDLFQYSELNEFTYVGLDYFNEENLSLQSISRVLAIRIPNHSTILGWSFGGLIAITLAYLFPDKVKKLILLASQPKFLEDLFWKGITHKIADHFVETAQYNFKQLKTSFISLVNYPSHNSKYKKHLEKNYITHHDVALVKLLKVMFSTDLRHEYQAIKSKILHIVSNRDAVLPQTQHQLRQLKSNVEIVSLDKVGHAGFLTHGKVYRDIIKNFLSNE